VRTRPGHVRLSLQVPREVHARVASAAQAADVSLATWVRGACLERLARSDKAAVLVTRARRLRCARQDEARV
jgi:hypothetical protein